ncbi:FAD dependent oxidoreductase [Podospora appendiculata]|uniref:FAD dependent oxidoreductase n=1 Tax=Podospora appendiculata TaxID=314037 RepID=A0AAE0XHM2_9PEZI|nr:FAD dependent oxidoreductase [Podospora appendiculata]
MSRANSMVLIIGGGTFGLSTAYHLANAGYRNITVLEKGATVPSPLSAGNDLNKIVRAEYEEPYYAELALAAIAEWTSNPLFAPHYRQVGYLLGNSAAALEKSRTSLAKSLASIQTHPAFAGQITPINSREDIRAVAPALDGAMDGWVGYFNRLAGYARSADALRATYDAVNGLGVGIALDDAVATLDYDGHKCVGATTASGKRYTADVVILTMGASVANLLPSIGHQVTGRSWAIAHVQLTPEEAAKLAGIPVTYSRDLGFFFEPDPTGLLKVSPSGSGYTNKNKETGISVPPEDNNFMPPAEEEAIRKVLREHLPSLAERPLVNTKICWCADTADTDYIIDFVPGKEGLIVATGDSGHAFKMLPLVGGWVKDVLENGKQDIARWAWKEGNNAGGEVSWRVGKSRDLNDYT